METTKQEDWKYNIPDHIHQQVDSAEFEECTAERLQGFSVIAADKELDLCMLYGSYTCWPLEKYLIIITADDDNISMQIARVSDE